MPTFKTTLSSIFSQFKHYLLNNRSTNVYDILRPLYYTSFLMGLTQFDVRRKKFRSCIWLILWNSAIMVVSTAAALIALTSRVFTGKADAMYTIMDVALGWVSFANIDVMIIFGCVFKNTVNFRFVLKLFYWSSLLDIKSSTRAICSR